MAARITEGGGRGVGGSMGSKRVKVSPTVTVKAKPGQKVSQTELARLKKINARLDKKTTPKEKKVNAKALKASGVEKPKTDTMYTRSTNQASDPFAKTKLSARYLAREAAIARRAGKAY